MAYYDALIAAWNSATQPPAGVTGAGLVAGDTTQQKINKINAWTVVGAAIPMVIPTYRIYNVIDPTEYANLTPTKQDDVKSILGMGTVDVSSGTLCRTRMLSMFGAGTTTRTNLSNLAKPYDTPTVLWCAANGYPLNQQGTAGGLTLTDASNAGLV